MGTGGRTGQTDGAGAENVIQFPRDYFGSKDDLVPFGPAADRLEAEAAAARAAAGLRGAAVTDVDVEADDDLSSALSANDFWGGSAGALHQPVDAEPNVEPSPPTPNVEVPDVLAAFAKPGQKPPAWAVPDTEPEHLNLAVRRTAGLSVTSWQFPVRISLRPALGVVAAVIAVVVAVVAVTHAGGSGHRAHPATSTLARAPRATAPQASATAATAAVLAASKQNSADVALVRRAQAQAREAVRAEARKQALAKAHRKTRSKVVSHKPATTHSSAADQTSGTSPDVALVSTSDDVASASVSAPAATSHSSTSSASSSSAAGPSGPGGAVGANCNPKCSAQ